MRTISRRCADNPVDTGKGKRGSSNGKAGISGIEVRSIDCIPDTERYGKIADQGPFWFASNFQFLSISLGFIGPSMGLSFVWTAIAGVAGILLGTVFMALHATQGPVLGLPQMIQSRAQFGYRGVIVPLLGVFINCAGVNVVLALQTMGGLHNLYGWNQYLVLAAITVPSALLAIIGYDWIHRVFRSLFWISLPLIGLLTFWICVSGAKAGLPPKLGFSSIAFGVQFVTCVSYNIAFAPYVSDYSRYLPRATRPSSLIANVFIGAAGSAAWLVVLGAALAARFNASNPIVALDMSGDLILHGFGSILVIDSIVILFAIIALDNYSGMLSVVTAADSFKPVPRTRLVRTIVTCVFTASWLLATLIFGQNGETTLGLVLTIVLYLLIPWTSVNLVDFFLIKHGRYSIEDLSRPGGIYPDWAWPGLLSYGLGWMSIVPFAVLPGLWTGPIANKIGGIDVGWLSGILVSGLSYYFIARRRSLDSGIENPAAT